MHSPIGQFLEISLASDDVVASLGFYESLGFRQLTTGDMYEHPYAVVSDGRLVLGIHSRDVAGPALTFMLPDLRSKQAWLEDLGVEIGFTAYGDEHFNELHFETPDGQLFCLVEARTFSPSDTETVQFSGLGYFSEYRIPVVDPDESIALWEALGFVAIDRETADDGYVELTSDALSVSLYSHRLMKLPALVFTDDDWRERAARLGEKGFDIQKKKRPVPHVGLFSPEDIDIRIVGDVGIS